MSKGSEPAKRVKFKEVVRLVKETCKDPIAAGIERVIGLEHLEPDELQVHSWNDVAEGTTFTTRVRPGQVLFGKRRAYQRKVAVADFHAVCSGDIYVFESANPERLLPELLPFICQSDAFLEHAVGTSAGSLSPRTNWSSLAEYEFEVPALNEQRRIARVLESARATADQHRELVAWTKGLKRAVIAEQIPGLARGRYARLSSLSQIVRGSTPRPASDPRYFNGSFVPWITVGEITADEMPYLTRTSTMLTEAGAGKSRLLKRGTVVLSNSGYSLGVPKILSIDGCANDGVAAFLELDASVNSLFLYYVLWGMTELFRTRVAAGGDQPNLNTQRIGAVEIPMPPRDDQDSVAELLFALDQQLAQLLTRREQLKKAIAPAILKHSRIGG